MFTLFMLPFKIARTFLKLAGIRGALLLGVGVGIGLLIAPTSGARLRAELQTRLRGDTPDGAPERAAVLHDPAAGPA